MKNKKNMCIKIPNMCIEIPKFHNNKLINKIITRYKIWKFCRALKKSKREMI